jgi:hypothetical protein
MRDVAKSVFLSSAADRELYAYYGIHCPDNRHILSAAMSNRSGNVFVISSKAGGFQAFGGLDGDGL